MQRYWSSLRYSFLRTLFLLAADLRRHEVLGHFGSALPLRLGFIRLRARLVLASWEYPSPLYCLICHKQGGSGGGPISIALVVH